MSDEAIKHQKAELEHSYQRLWRKETPRDIMHHETACAAFGVVGGISGSFAHFKSKTKCDGKNINVPTAIGRKHEYVGTTAGSSSAPARSVAPGTRPASKQASREKSHRTSRAMEDSTARSVAYCRACESEEGL